MYNNKKAFTFIELVVATVILVLISSIGFYSFVDYLSETRDGSRKSDIIAMGAALKLHKQTRGVYPLPGDYFSITNNGAIVAYQGEFNENLKISDLDELPSDPRTKGSYMYSTKKNRQDYQIAITLENGDFPIAMVEGSYKTISKNVLPSLLLALSSTSSVEIHDGVGAGTTNRDYFILNLGDNLPYSLNGPYDPYYAGGDVDDALIGSLTTYLQGSSYTSCIDIGESKETIGAGEYQVLTGSGLLSTITCDSCSSIGLIDSRDSCDIISVGLCGTDNSGSITSEPFGTAACSTGNKYNYKWNLTTATWECKGAGANEGTDDQCSATYTP